MQQYSEDDFAFIIKNSNSYAECLRKLGYNSSSGASFKKLKERINELGLNVDHFSKINKTKRNEKNVFTKNSTACQSVVREWFRKGNYSKYVCSICEQEPFWNGKPLIMILDHINGDNKDNRLDNLRWVCPNCNYQLDTTNGKNRKHKLHKLNYCIDCGAIVSRNSIRCMTCNKKYRLLAEDTMSVDRDTLKKLIRQYPFTRIGEIYGVSDNAVRKWCNKYGLPTRSRSIKKLSDDEWSNL